MLAETVFPLKWRRLWRRRLRRRPLLPFLLAATLAVDMLIAASIDARRDTLATVVGFSFLLAQVGLIAAWSLHTPRWVAQRLLLALGVSVVLGWWFFTNDTDNLLWYATFVLAADVFVLSGYHWFRSRKLLRPKRRRYGIGGLMAWTTIAAVSISALRSVDWSQTFAVLQQHEVWSGVFLDAFIVALTIAVASRRWSTAATIIVVVATGAVLLIGRLAISRIVQMGVVYYMSQQYVDAAHEHIATTLYYQATFVATLLIWALGIRYLPSSLRQPTEADAVGEVAIKPTETIDLTA